MVSFVRGLMNCFRPKLRLTVSASSLRFGTPGSFLPTDQQANAAEAVSSDLGDADLF